MKVGQTHHESRKMTSLEAADGVGPKFQTLSSLFKGNFFKFEAQRAPHAKIDEPYACSELRHSSREVSVTSEHYLAPRVFEGLLTDPSWGTGGYWWNSFGRWTVVRQVV